MKRSLRSNAVTSAPQVSGWAGMLSEQLRRNSSCIASLLKSGGDVVVRAGFGQSSINVAGSPGLR